MTVTLTGLVSNDPEITLDLLPANVTATVNITDSDTLTIISDATATVPENTPAGTVIIDVNTNDTPDNTVIYTLSGVDALLFNINPATGEITFVNSPDFEFNVCRVAFGFVHGRNELACEGPLFDRCVDAFRTQRTMQAAIATLTKDASFCREGSTP